MSSYVEFGKINKTWQYSGATFELMFTGIVALYIDRLRANEICNDLRYQIGDYLSRCWPEKYASECGKGIDTLIVSKFPRAEQMELLRASEEMLRDLMADRVDRRLGMAPHTRPYFIKVLGEFITLMREELAAR